MTKSRSSFEYSRGLSPLSRTLGHYTIDKGMASVTFADDPGKTRRVAGVSYTYTARSRTLRGIWSARTLRGIWSGSGWNCEHGRRRNQCAPCGGASVCPHGRQRHQCTAGCGGSGVCRHGRVRSQCVPCGGASVCPHGRRRSQCKTCATSTERDQHSAFGTCTFTIEHLARCRAELRVLNT